MELMEEEHAISLIRADDVICLLRSILKSTSWWKNSSGILTWIVKNGVIMLELADKIDAQLESRSFASSAVVY